MAGSSPSIRVAPREVLRASSVALAINGTVKHIIVTTTEVYQVETAEIPGFVAVNDYIIPSADLSLTHPFDPLFFLLPGLLAKKDKFRELSDIAEDVNCPDLLTCTRTVSNLPAICDVKVVGDNAYYRLSPPLLQAWLQRKYSTLASDINSAVPSFTSEIEVSLPAKVSALCIFKELIPDSLFTEMMAWAEVTPDTMERVCNPTLKRACDAPLATPLKQAKPTKAKVTAPPRGTQAITGFFKPKN